MTFEERVEVLRRTFSTAYVYNIAGFTYFGFHLPDGNVELFYVTESGEVVLGGHTVISNGARPVDLTRVAP